MNNKDPAFLFYSSDFLTECSDLTMEERGQYITLICLQHQKGHLNEKTIRLNVGSVSDDVLVKFSKDENGCYYNKIIEELIEKRRAFAESRRKNGALGGRPKAIKKPNEKPSGYPNGKPNENLFENENENENIYINNNLNCVENFETLFFDFWNKYIPVTCNGKYVAKGSKQAAYLKFIEELKAGIPYEDIDKGLKKYLQYCKDNSQLTCKAVEFLNQRRWLDDLDCKSEEVNNNKKKERSQWRGF